MINAFFPGVFAVLVAFVACLSSAQLRAQSVDLLQSYDAALAEDVDWQAARAGAEGARESLPMARAQLLPNLAMSAAYMKNNLTTDTYTSTGQPYSYDRNYPSKNYALSLRQPIYRPQLYVGYLQAEARMEGIDAILDKAGQDLALRVITAYFNLLLADESLRQTETQGRAIALQMQAAQRAWDAGFGTRTDVDDARARLDINRARLVGARQQIEQARHELAILLNRPVSRVAPLDSQRLPLTMVDTAKLEDWIDRATEASPDMRDLRARVEAARLEVERVRAGHKPTLDLIVQRSISDSDSVTSVGNRYDNSQVGVQLAVPLFSGGYVNAQERQARAALLESELRLEAARRKLATQVRKEYQGIDQGIHKIRALELALQSADQSVVSNEKGFLAGVRSRVDVLNAEDNRGNVVLELARERMLLVMSRARLQSLCNRLDRDALQTINHWLAYEK